MLISITTEDILSSDCNINTAEDRLEGVKQ